MNKSELINELVLQINNCEMYAHPYVYIDVETAKEMKNELVKFKRTDWILTKDELPKWKGFYWVTICKPFLYLNDDCKVLYMPSDNVEMPAFFDPVQKIWKIFYRDATDQERTMHINSLYTDYESLEPFDDLKYFVVAWAYSPKAFEAEPALRPGGFVYKKARR